MRKKPTNRTEAIASDGCLWLGGGLKHDEFCANNRARGSVYCRQHLKAVYNTGSGEKKKVEKLANFIIKGLELSHGKTE